MKKPPTRTKLKQKADVLFSKLVRSAGVCAAAEYVSNEDKPPFVVVDTLDDGTVVTIDLRAPKQCSGTLQCAHLVPRMYLSVRWDEGNAVALCSGHHMFFSYNPLEWENWVMWFMGEEAWWSHKRRALAARGAPDYEAVISRLEQRLKEVGDARTP